MKKTIFGTIVLALMLLCGSKIFAQGNSPNSSYTKIAADDKKVVAAANFAVGEMNKNKNIPPITLVSIKRAEKQVGEGVKYHFCLAIKSGETPQTVESVVFQNPKNKLILYDWETKDCDEQ